ncbi:MAG: prephenate dehydrogenase/arogenate dehydrogenase family protein [Parachlamydia sp.]|nr:prephenate dehydrogenase/arogenate dehydrogenase family protein [Parachlamydia sp.]
MHSIDTLRLLLDDIDLQIATLLNARIEVVKQIGLIKKKEHLGIVDVNREQQVIEHVKSAIQHPVLKEKIGEIYQLIIQDSRIHQQFYQFTDFPFRRVGFIGFGLIGGSICKAIRTKLPKVQINALHFESEDQSKAMSEGWIDKICETTQELALSSDLILLAAPISTMIPYAKELSEVALDAAHPLVVADVASVKDDIVSLFEKLSNSMIEFVGTHPMAGREIGGFSNSAATLFVEAPWILVPHSANTDANLKKIEQLIQFCGSNPCFLDKLQHDRRVALVSHLPAYLARCFLKFVQKDSLQAMESAGPGFHSFTRLAHDNPAMHQEILQKNRPNIAHYLQQWMEFLTAEGF